MTEFKQELKSLGFNFLDNALDDTYIKMIKVEFVNLNECYSYDKTTGELVLAHVGIGVNGELLDEIAYPDDGRQDKETTKQAAIEHFSKCGKLDLSGLDEGNIYIMPNEKRPLIHDGEFLAALNNFMEDVRNIFE